MNSSHFVSILILKDFNPFRKEDSMVKKGSYFLGLLFLFSLPLTGETVHPPLVIPATDEELSRRTGEKPDQIPLGPVGKREGFSLSQLSWSFLGPQPILNEYWSGDDDASGRISAIIVHPTDPDLLYLAGAQGGVWKSIDNGVNWTPLTDQLSSLASGALAFDPFDTDIIYYATGEQHYSGDCFYGDGLFKTTDGGMSWTKIALRSSVGSYIARILVKPTDSNILHLASELGYLRSTDGGSSWTLEIGTDDCNDIVLSPGAPTTLFAGIRSDGVYKSTDDGATWDSLTNGLPSSGFQRINLAISFSDTNTVYASFVSNSGSLYGMYKTTDGGANWSNLPNTPNYLCSQGWYDNCVIVDPTDPDICYAGGVHPAYCPAGLIKTTNGGNSWTDITDPPGPGPQLHPDQHILAFGPDMALWVGNDGGIWKTTDGGQSWINRNNTLGITQFYTVGLHPTSDTFLLGGTQDNGTARYEGNLGWPQVSGGDGGPCPVEWDSPNIYYTTYVALNPVWKWDNGVYQGDVTGPWSGEWADWANGPLVTDPNQANTILAGTYHVWRTTNSGGSWDSLSGDLTGGGVLRSIAVAQGSSDILFTGSSSGRVYVTTNGGTNWNLRNSGLPTTAIPDVYIDPLDWQTAYLCADVSFGGRVFKTTNAGVNWTNITGDLPTGLRGMSFTVNFATTPPSLYLGTDYGVYSSINDGVNWVKEGNNLPNLAIYEMGYDGVNNFLVAATHGRGMWRASTLVGVEEEGDFGFEIEDLRLQLLQNQPNPFHHTTTIRYQIPQPPLLKGARGISIQLAIYDITGRLVKTLVNGPQEPGVYQFPISNHQFPGSGIYFLKLAIEGDLPNTDIKKIVFIR